MSAAGGDRVPRSELTDVIVGPPSRPFKLADAANDPFVSTTPAEPEYGRQLSDAAKEELLRRCSALDVVEEVTRDMHDKRLAFNLRRRLLTWVDEGRPGAAESKRSQAKRKRASTSAAPTDEQEDGHDTSVEDGQATEKESREMAAMRGLEKGVPDCFKYQADPVVAEAFFERNSRQHDSVIDKPTPSRLLKTSRDDGKESRALATENDGPTGQAIPLLLSVSVYACSVTAPRARKRYDRIMRSRYAQSSNQTAPNGEEDDDGGSGSSTGSDDNGEDTDEQLYRGQHNTRKRGRKRKYGRRDGLYGELQLVQKIECRSDATLLDLRRGFVCRMDDHPEAVDSEAQFKAWAKVARKDVAAREAPILQRYTGRKRVTDSCMLIEDVLYGERSQEDEQYSYAHLLSSHFAAASKEGGGDIVASNRIMAGVRLDALDLRAGKLYWMLHQGSCEHLWAITSARSLRAEEMDSRRPEALHTQSSSVSTTFLLQSFNYRPLVRYMHPDRASGAYTLEKCNLCQARQASMTVVGGARFRPPPQSASEAVTLVADSPASSSAAPQTLPRVKLRGLPEESMGVCEVCWCGLVGRTPPGIAELTARAGKDAASDMSALPFAGAGGLGWTVIPALE